MIFSSFMFMITQNGTCLLGLGLCDRAMQNADQLKLVSPMQEDDVPLNARMAKIATPAKKPKLKEGAGSKPKPQAKPDKQKEKKRKQERAEERPVKRRKSEPRAKSESQGKDEGKDVKWSSLKHSGVLFPPEYVAHGVKMTYDSKPVELTPEQEEVRPVFLPYRPFTKVHMFTTGCSIASSLTH